MSTFGNDSKDEILSILAGARESGVPVGVLIMWMSEILAYIAEYWLGE